MSSLCILIVTVSTYFLIVPACTFAQSSQNNGTNMMQIIKEAREKKAKQEPSGNSLNNAKSSNTGKGVVIGEDDFFKAEEAEAVERKPEPTPETDSSVNTKPPKVDNIFDF